jgi:hypothetical protein
MYASRLEGVSEFCSWEVGEEMDGLTSTRLLDRTWNLRRWISNWNYETCVFLTCRISFLTNSAQ